MVNPPQRNPFSRMSDHTDHQSSGDNDGTQHIPPTNATQRIVGSVMQAVQSVKQKFVGVVENLPVMTAKSYAVSKVIKGIFKGFHGVHDRSRLRSLLNSPPSMTGNARLVFSLELITNR